MVRPLRAVALFVLLAGLAASAAAQSPENVAVVINDNSAVSQLVGEHYIEKRRIPSSNVIRIRTLPEETIGRDAYTATIEAPIAAALFRNGLQDRILYIVLMKGVPLRVAGTGGREGTVASVDSELTLLYRRMTGRAVTAAGFLNNPYFLADGEIGRARRFSHREHDIYLVSRIDGFTPHEAMALVDAALNPISEGQIVLDQRVALVNRGADDALALAAQKLRDQGHGNRVLLETTPGPATTDGPVLGYFSWGSTDPQLRRRVMGMRFVPGSLAATFTGADARTFQPPAPEWTPMSNPQNRSTWFGGSPQSLVGDLIREGATGVAGHVSEPFLEGVVRPEVLFSAYLGGFNLIESFYLAMPYLSWQTVVIGDPLCSPFERRALTRSDLEEGMDPSTELPGLFSARRLEVVRASTPGSDAFVRLIVLGDTRLRRGDTAGARSAFEEAVDAAPTLAAPLFQLAMLDEQAGAHDDAIARYRRILGLEPNNVIVLNNLAYGLAVRQGAPADAKPLAERAVSLSKRNATVVDTLGWIEYLMGNYPSAYLLLAEASKGAPANAEIRVHVAFAAAAVNRPSEAAEHLKEALRRNPALEQREDVAELRQRLSR